MRPPIKCKILTQPFKLKEFKNHKLSFIAHRVSKGAFWGRFLLCRKRFSNCRIKKQGSFSIPLDPPDKKNETILPK